MKKKLFLPGFLILLTIFGTILLMRISAQKTNNGLTVYPINFTLSGNRGETSTQQVTLQNQTDQQVTIGTTMYNFTAQGEAGQVALTSDTTNYSLASWITISPKTAVVPAHQSQTFNFTITVPQAAEPGGHFGSIVFQTIPDANLKTTGATVSQRLASLILFEVPGNVLENAEAQTLTTDKQFYEFGPVHFLLRVKNNGNVHVIPTGVVVITGWFGQHYEIPLDQYNILPQAVRQIPALLSKKYLLGTYTAHLVVSYGSKNQPLYASTVFYAFPVRYGLIVLGILIILFLFRKRLFKALKALATGK